MSIASEEAEKAFPAQYWPGYEPRRDYRGKLAYLDGVTTDDMREAYERGRTAEVTAEEIEAGAKALAQNLDGDWEQMPGTVREKYLADACIVLEFARRMVDKSSDMSVESIMSPFKCGLSRHNPCYVPGHDETAYRCPRCYRMNVSTHDIVERCEFCGFYVRVRPLKEV
ncbi:hypothetical protein OZX67_03890 [Bifidobacterium sp. ESL0728]|uniref:hypothetical protein n=1 Tax=Bifidobacterium sp. ESL0728 TaxID=2983220 RepID=UPI0023F7B761|nr:hypothetical protein [Bifidobacterium sp. ESL0728]WEV59689.1 hypothetical protein OZX67_03890 [Bifidobacterium sp. ESL0728]